MANIIVNTRHPYYVQVTANRGALGLGYPVIGQGVNDPNLILVSDSDLSLKKGKIEALKRRYELPTSGILEEANNFYKKVDNVTVLDFLVLDEDAVVYYFRKELVKILFGEQLLLIPPSAVGVFAAPYEIKEFSGYATERIRVYEDRGWFYAYNSGPYNIFDPSNRFAARDIVVRVLTDWIKLIDDILAITPGLSERPEPLQTELLQGIDESSRSDANFGVVTVNVINTTIPFSSAVLSASKALVNLKTLQFFDDTRELKTIVNFGDDRQYLAEAWRPVPSDSSSIQIKLRTPLRGDIELYDQSYIGLEFAKSVVDNITIELPPDVDDSLSLRPANTNVGKFKTDKQQLTNVTLGTLELLTGSIGNISASTISYDDRVFNRWYTSDFNSSELNIDFSDYNNFVFFGSAKSRLEAFKTKLEKIQSYPLNISVSSSIASERSLAIEKENIKRNFDPYEQYLYFASQSNEYTASAYYVDGGMEYNPTGSWPKDNNMAPLSYINVEDWYVTQSAIAERFDEFNPNYLIKHLPAYLQEDTNSTDFITFIKMFGHVMDNLKIYIDQFPNIYSTSPDPFSDLSMDQVYEVAKSFGFDLPNAFSLETLQTFIASLYDGPGARSFVAETWKRFLHSSPYIKKLKGSKTGVDAIINTYGLNSPLVQVKESTYAVDNNYIKSDELVYALQFNGLVSSSVWVPLVSSSYTASTLQVRFVPDDRKQSSLLTTNGTWGIELIPHPSASTTSYFNTQSLRNPGISYFTLNVPTISYGKIHVVSGSNRTVIASSSYFPLFSSDYTHIMLRSQSRDITIIQTDGDQILFQESASILGSVNWRNLWNSTYIYLGGTGSLRFTNFDGIIDDVRVWGEEISTDNFIKQAYDPGSYYGTNYSSSYNSLYVDLSFSQPYASITQSATNETPFFRSSSLSYIPAQGFTTASYTRILRTIKQFTPVVGSSIFSNRKVIVADPPSFNQSFVDVNGTKILQRNSSIKPLEDKKYIGGLDYVQFAVSPTDFVNQTIMRSMGDIDTNYLIGSPEAYDSEKYTELEKIFDFFLKNYNESINVNEYIRFFKNVLSAPAEYVETYIPARAKLVDGIVIESPFLSRRKETIQKAIRVDGSNTKTFIDFVAGTASKYVGAYSFDAIYTMSLQENTTIIDTPVIQQIGTVLVTSSLLSPTGIAMIDMVVSQTGSAGLVSSTVPSSLPTGRRFLQKVGNTYVSSSLADDKSSVTFIEGLLTASYESPLTQSGYARQTYNGLLYPYSTIYRIPSEENTIDVYYPIPPRSDFDDPATTTYFTRRGGIYKFPDQLGSLKQYKFNKKAYRVKYKQGIGEIESALPKEFGQTTLISPTILSDLPGRFTAKISEKTYAANSIYRGVMNIDNIFSLYAVNVVKSLSSLQTGKLRFRLYRTVDEQTNDLERSFEVTPDSDAGVLFDGLLTESEFVFPYTVIQTLSSTLYFTIDNIAAEGSGIDITSAIILTGFSYEPADLTPNGYSPNHYKFSRDNSIALKRKKWLGCRIVYCPNGPLSCPPGVTATTTSNPITFGNAPSVTPTKPPNYNPNIVGFGGSGQLR